MDCYGSEHCCRPENQCDLHEGDCNEDKDCTGMDWVHVKVSAMIGHNLNVFYEKCLQMNRNKSFLFFILFFIFLEFWNFRI